MAPSHKSHCCLAQRTGFNYSFINILLQGTSKALSTADHKKQPRAQAEISRPLQVAEKSLSVASNAAPQISCGEVSTAESMARNSICPIEGSLRTMVVILAPFERGGIWHKEGKMKSCAAVGNK